MALHIAALNLALGRLVALLYPPRREDGQSMIEYALLAGLVSVSAVAVLMLMGPYMKTMFQDVVNALNLT